MHSFDLVSNKLVWIRKNEEQVEGESRALIKMPLITLYINNIEETSIEVRWVRLLKECEKNLLKKFQDKVVHSYLKELYEVEIGTLVSSKNSSLAFFHSEEFTGFVEFPKTIYDNYFISKSFHLKPIFTWLQKEFDFYLLSLSKKQIKLFKGSVLGLELEKEWENQDQDKTSKSIENWENFFRKTENELDKIFSKNRTPVILAGLKEQVAFYKKINRDKDLVMMSIPGSINGKTTVELKAEAIKILNDIFEMNKKNIIQNYHDKSAIQMATDEITLVTQNAIKGKIKVLAIAEDRNLWGRINMFEGKVNLSREGASQFNDDLLDDLAEVVLSRGGRVLSLKQVEMPTKSPLFAIL